MYHLNVKIFMVEGSLILCLDYQNMGCVYMERKEKCCSLKKYLSLCIYPKVYYMYKAKAYVSYTNLKMENIQLPYTYNLTSPSNSWWLKRNHFEFGN